MKTFDLYEYYSPKLTSAVKSHNCSACGINIIDYYKVEDEYLCEDCHTMHQENLADAQDEAETMNELTYWGIGV